MVAARTNRNVGPMKFTNVVFALAALSIATRRIQSQSVDTAATKSSLLAADAALSRRFATEGTEALLSVLDPKGAILIPEQPILRAGDAARAALMKRYGAPSQYRWIAKHAVASTDGNFGCTIGVIRFTSGADTLTASVAECMRHVGSDARAAIGTS
jgi:hypothetical protein